jgi:hypothetical protein
MGPRAAEPGVAEPGAAGSGFGLRSAWSRTAETDGLGPDAEGLAAPGFGSNTPGSGAAGWDFGATQPGAGAAGPGFEGGPGSDASGWGFEADRPEFRATRPGFEAGAPEPASDGGFGSAAPGLDAETRGTGGVLPSRTAGTYRGLPRRVRQANLPQQLRDAPVMGAQGAGGPEPGPAAGRTAEQARNVVASFRSAYQRELGDATPGAPSGADAPATWAEQGETRLGETRLGEGQQGEAQQAGGQAADAHTSGERQTTTPQQEEM